MAVLSMSEIEHIITATVAKTLAATAPGIAPLNRRLTVREFAVCIDRGPEYVREQIRGGVIPREMRSDKPYMIHPQALKIFGVTPDIANARLAEATSAPKLMAPDPRVVWVRGVRPLFRPGKPSPYGVQWPTKESCPRTGNMVRRERSRFFPTAAARDQLGKEIIDARREGRPMDDWPHADIAEYRAFKAATKGEPWQNVVAAWKAHHKTT